MVEMAPQSWHSAMNSAMGHAMLGAMVGGTTSVITGGGMEGFVNGAMTGAMQQLFNHWAHEDAQKEVPERFKEILEKAGIDLEKNIALAEGMSFPEWYEAVKSGGDWDYKSKLIAFGFDPKLLDDFGNYHFGVVAAAVGFNLEWSLYGAGVYQVLRQGGGNMSDLRAATNLLRLTGGGYLLPDLVTRNMTNSGFTWGDNPGDSINIMNGWDFYHGSR
jgi:hypothetical protein